ncbi:MAG: iron ABC transporter permease, partial [Verrucomicrobiota bacterium]
RVLGRGPGATLRRVHLPLMRGAILAAAMLLFIDLLKELPLTLVLRPVNFETLATSAFSFAKETKFDACAVPSLLIVACGAIGVAIMNRFFYRSDD